MKILFVNHNSPFPPHDGGRIRTYNLLQWVARRHQTTLLAFAADDTERNGLEHLGGTGIEVITVPRPDVPKRNLADKARVAARRHPISLEQYCSNDMARQISALERRGFDVIHVDHLYLARYFANGPRIPAVLTHHNVEAIGQRRELWQRRQPWSLRWWARWPEHLRWRHYEIEVSRHFDGLVAVSDLDARYFRRHVPGVPVAVVPNGVDTDNFRPGADTEPTPPDVLFAGRLDYPPNVDAVRWFADRVLPAVRAEVATARFVIVGRAPAPEVRALAERTGIILAADVPDIRPFYHRSAVVVVPLRFGSGTRLKIPEAMAMGKAIVTTSLGREGLGTRAGTELLVADTSAAFAFKVVAMLRDPAARSRLGGAARRAAEDRYAWLHSGALQLAAYETAIAHRRARTPA